jgi:hypothetical protein
VTALLHPPQDVLPAAEAAFKGEIDAILRTVQAGAARRIQAAKTVLGKFGVASECGLSSTTLENYPATLAMHRKVAQLL